MTKPRANRPARTTWCLVLGTLKQSYSAYGSIVGGAENKDAGQYATVLGQENSTAGPLTSVTGGGGNTASGYFSSVTGGYLNVASNNKASVTGGTGNEAGGEYSSISGGGSNTDEAAAKSTRFSAVWTKNSPATTKSTRQLHSRPRRAVGRVQSQSFSTTTPTSQLFSQFAGICGGPIRRDYE